MAPNSLTSTFIVILGCRLLLLFNLLTSVTISLLRAANTPLRRIKLLLVMLRLCNKTEVYVKFAVVRYICATTLQLPGEFKESFFLFKLDFRIQ